MSPKITVDDQRAMLCAELMELERSAAARSLDQQDALWLTVSHVARKLCLYLAHEN